MIVLDTHIWLWFILGDIKLNKKTKHLIETKIDEVIVPVICLWETILLGETGRLKLDPTPVEFVRMAIREFNFKISPISTEIAILSRELQFSHSDPADRFIATTAYVYEAPLATEDTRLRELSWLKVI